MLLKKNCICIKRSIHFAVIYYACAVWRKTAIRSKYKLFNCIISFLDVLKFPSLTMCCMTQNESLADCFTGLILRGDLLNTVSTTSDCFSGRLKQKRKCDIASNVSECSGSAEGFLFFNMFRLDVAGAFLFGDIKVNGEDFVILSLGWTHDSVLGETFNMLMFFLLNQTPGII